MQKLKFCSRCRIVLVPQIIKRQNDESKRLKKSATVRGQLQFFDPLLLVAF